MPDTNGGAVVTGASGFVGRALVRRLPAAHALRFGVDDWQARLDAVDLCGRTIFHLAARVHSPHGSEEAFHRDNVVKTQALAERAAATGARRIVFVSTIKVHGEESRGRPFEPSDKAAPEDAYARSKAEGERALADVAERSALEVVVVRPPLVYGPSAGANLAALMRLADSPWPLPFAALDARRSFIHVDDLAELLVACGREPVAAGKTYIGANAQGASAEQTVSLMRGALGRERRLFAVSAPLLEAAASAAGQRDKARRLTRPLLGDPTLAMRELAWSARVPIEHAVGEMVREYRARGNH